MSNSSTETLQGTLLDPLRCMDIHRGAIDQATITTKPPSDVMRHVKEVLKGLGIEVQVEGDYKYRCIRPKMGSTVLQETKLNQCEKPKDTEATVALTAYGNQSEDPAHEVRFSVELTRLDRLKDMYSLDIRRLKGNLRSYKFLYDTIRDRADLNRKSSNL